MGNRLDNQDGCPTGIMFSKEIVGRPSRSTRNKYNERDMVDRPGRPGLGECDSEGSGVNPLNIVVFLVVRIADPRKLRDFGDCL